MAQALRIVVSASPGERRTALLNGDTLLEAWVERPARPDGVGDLHRARVTALAPAMAGAFLLLGDGSTGFLPEREASATRQPIGASVNEGMVLPVRITRAAQGGKGPRVTARISPAEAVAAAGVPGNAPALLARGPTAVERLMRAYAAAPVITDSAALRVTLGAARVTMVHRAFDDALEAEFAQLAEPEVRLPGGGRILVCPTPALTALDVDAGSAAGSSDPLAQERLNLAAVQEAARQIRLRNLAGPILLDVAGMAPKRREALAEPLAKALDPQCTLKGLGPLGLFEMLRARVHPPLQEVLGWPPSALTLGLAALRQAAREAAAAPGRRLALRAAPAVVSALETLPGALADFAEAATWPVSLRADAALRPGQEAIEDLNNGG